MSAGTEIALYLIRNLGALLLFVVILRGVLHASRVNFYNPLSQMIVKLTNPLLTPLRGALPATGRIDWAVWVLAVLLQSLILVGIAWIAGERWTLPGVATVLLWGVIGVIAVLVNLYFFILIAMIVVSWIAPGSRHPDSRVAASGRYPAHNDHGDQHEKVEIDQQGENADHAPDHHRCKSRHRPAFPRYPGNTHQNQ